MKAIDVAKNVIIYASQQGKNVTNLKLQKTLYYLQGYFFKKHKQPLFEEECLRWEYGPVVPEVYFRYSVNGWMGISPEANSSFETTIDDKLFKQVVDACLWLPASELVTRSHQETPWKSSQSNAVIRNDVICDYFEVKNPLSIKL